MNSTNRIRKGISQKQSAEMKYLQSPCTLVEASQIARGVAEDVVSDYHNRTGHLQIVMSLQLEILKDIVIKAGLITEEEFKEKYIQQAEAYNAMQEKEIAAIGAEKPEGDNSPSMKVDVSEVEVQKV